LEPVERRSQILGHAARLFGDKGYHHTSINDIIVAAGVARGTFYLYFANKRRIFEELVDILLLRLASCIQPVETDPQAPSAREQLLDNMVRVLALLGGERHLLSILLKGAVGLDREIDDKLREFYSEVLKSIERSLSLGREIGLVRPCDTRIGALIALGAIKEILAARLEADDVLIDEEAIRAEAAGLLDIFSRGVLAEGVSIP